MCHDQIFYPLLDSLMHHSNPQNSFYSICVFFVWAWCLTTIFNRKTFFGKRSRMSTISLSTLTCHQTRSSLNIVAFSIGIVFTLLSCIVSYKYMTMNHQKERKQLLCIGKVFCITSILTLFTLSGRVLCLDVIIARSNRIFYVSQLIIMLFIYYWRMVLVFRDTTFEFNKCIIWFYRFLFTIFATLAVLWNIDVFECLWL